MTTGCIWKRKQLHKSLYETRVSSAKSSYMMLCSELPTPLSVPHRNTAVAGLNAWMIFLHKSLCAEKLINYWRLLFLIFVFAVYKRTLSYAIGFYCLFLYIHFIC